MSDSWQGPSHAQTASGDQQGSSLYAAGGSNNPTAAAIVGAIHRVRCHSRACHDIAARTLLIRVERQIIALLLATGPPEHSNCQHLERCDTVSPACLQSK